ncbi:MAG TPA: phosphotransferase family protein [Acidimicrobiales bacterium]|nr:phosphotransferase family protein [Acidimicrobiales bacterium]
MEAEELTGALRDVVAKAFGDASVEVVGLRQLSGGASRETWSFDARTGEGARSGLILRRDLPDAPGSGMGGEARLLSAAARAGVPVPGIVAASDDHADLGASFIVMERVEGETIPRRILRDEAFAAVRPRLAAECGRALASIHRIAVGDVPGLEHVDQVEAFRAILDDLGEPHPAFEIGFRWLEANRVGGERTAVVHGDFRNGNLIVGPDGIRAVLDWELAHVGDPIEDLGWLCVKSWRFGEPLPVGGFGTYEQLLDAYERASGWAVDRAALRWWQTLGTLKWGVMCIMQAARHTSGAVRSVELAAIGRRACEMEWDLLALVAPGTAPVFA